MEYNLKILTETKHSVFIFEQTQYAKTFDEIVDYVNELATIYKKSAKIVIVISDENKKKIAQYIWDYGWVVY